MGMTAGSVSDALYEVINDLESLAYTTEIASDDHALRLTQFILAKLYQLARWVKEEVEE